MANFEDTVARMKALYTYGTVNENSNKQSNNTLEFSKKAADGKYYGIVKECNHYYIKQTSEGKQNLAESYEYIGGFMNKKNYQYDSYANALKNLELKLSSINEAHESKVNIATLDPFKKEGLVVEATDKMKDEIARQRQIMYNAAMLMKESANIGFTNVGTPEAPKGSNDADKPFTETSKATLDKDIKETANDPEKQGEPFGDSAKSEEGKDVKDSDIYSDGKAVAAEHPSGGKVVKVNEEKAMGEDTNLEWGSEGLPSEEGVGSPDGHLMEADDEEFEDEEDDFSDEDFDIDGDEEDVEDADIESDDDFNSEEVEDVDDDECEGGECELKDEEEPVEEPVDETDADSIRAEIERLSSKLAELEGEDKISDDSEEIEDTEVSEEEPVEGEEEVIDDVDDFDDDDEEEEDADFTFESKKKMLDTIVESVVKSFINEDELHVFGDHPGYRKKPMTLPQTGSDKNEHGEDWNDESVHSEEPFGKEIGSSAPFDELVKAVTDDVKYQLTHGAMDTKKKVK